MSYEEELNIQNLKLTLADVQHERDSELISSIMNCSAVNKITEIIQKNNLEEIYAYVFRSSYAELTGDNAEIILNMVKKACDIFGVSELPRVYLTREYGGTIEVKGFTEPFILIYSRYLEIADEISLFGEIAAAVAGIAANHHKAAFIADVLDILANQLPQIAALGYDAIINQWKRSRYFTYDRAVFKVTGNYDFTLRHILLGRVPNEMLKQTEKQLHDMLLYQKEVFVRLVDNHALFAMLQKIGISEAWIPDRFNELLQYSEETTP